MNTNKVFN